MIKILIGIFVAVAAVVFTTSEIEQVDDVKDIEVIYENNTIKDTSAIENKVLLKPIYNPEYTVVNGVELYEALLSARSEEVIYIPGDIEINLTPVLKSIKNIFPPRFEIRQNITLVGDGTRFGENGALLFVTSDVKDELFRIHSGAVISGLRIKGPQKDVNLIGIQAYNSPGDTILIENCEFWGWNQAVIRNRGDSSKTALKNIMIVRNNYIHDTVFKSGYGIAAAFNSYTLVEYNKFKNNRHDIAASGKYGCDYTFRYNTNIGQWLNPKTNKKSHSVDVHGWPFDASIMPNAREKNRQAGSKIEIYGNHFKDTGNNEVIHIRGIPEFYVRIYDNKFASTNATPIEQKYIDVPDSSKKMDIRGNRFKEIF